MIKRHVRIHNGITPACAGNSILSRSLAASTRDHPRLRGEQKIFFARFLPAKGSPPLARGTVHIQTRTTTSCRITPACAGNSVYLLSIMCCKRDHPRLRGEQLATTVGAQHILGSPPLARGTEGGAQMRPPQGRITPACAGNSRPFSPRNWGSRDHPRLRGEQAVKNVSVARMVGSPPLARGTEELKAKAEELGRITPACAGNSNTNIRNTIFV